MKTPSKLDVMMFHYKTLVATLKHGALRPLALDLAEDIIYSPDIVKSSDRERVLLIKSRNNMSIVFSNPDYPERAYVRVSGNSDVFTRAETIVLCAAYGIHIKLHEKNQKELANSEMGNNENLDKLLGRK